MIRGLFKERRISAIQGASILVMVVVIVLGNDVCTRPACNRTEAPVAEVTEAPVAEVTRSACSSGDEEHGKHNPRKHQPRFQQRQWPRMLPWPSCTSVSSMAQPGLAPGPSRKAPG
jgi:hypothetical protein